MEHKVLIIIGDATETVDTMYPYFLPLIHISEPTSPY